jgi:glycerol-3-phosphate O-acyltransferase
LNWFSDLVYRTAGVLLYKLVKTKVMPESIADLKLDPAKPVIYVLPIRRLSDWLVLIEETLWKGLPTPNAPITVGAERFNRGIIYLGTRRSLLADSPKVRRAVAAKLQNLVKAGMLNENAEVQLVPVSIIWGRAPARQQSLLKALLSEGWAVRGALAQSIAIGLHGRDTLVKFGDPILLQKILHDAKTDGQAQDQASRRVARHLRSWFGREREAVIGPDFSHRRTLIGKILNEPSVVNAVQVEASAKKVNYDKAESTARRYLMEISSDYSYQSVRVYEILLNWLWNRLYDGVKIYGASRLDGLARDKTLVYVPCHRSHIDYLLLSYVVKQQGRMLPHVAAGANLNMPIVGGLLRRGGAFFLRRSFKGNDLYATVFNEYLHNLIQQGFPIEYFVEGGRSRTGRTLAAKGGMVSMTIRSFLRDPGRPLVFIPVYVGYEKIVEQRSYLNELRGAKKEKESLLGVLKTLRALKERYGKVHLRFGEPIDLQDHLDSVNPAWRSERLGVDDKPEWLFTATDQLGRKIVTAINESAVVTPLCLLALTLLATPKLAMDEQQLIASMRIVSALFAPEPEVSGETNSDPIIAGAGAVTQGIVLGYLKRIAHPMGNVIAATDNGGALLAYFRNNVLHKLAVPGLIASLVSLNGVLSRRQVAEVVTLVMPVVRNELFLPAKDTGELIDQAIERLQAVQLVLDADGLLSAPAVNTMAAAQLEIIAELMQPTLTRLFVALSLIRASPADGYDAAKLEQVSEQTAQRFALLMAFDSPEFHDRNLFKQLIATLNEQGLISFDSLGKIVATTELNRLGDLAAISLPNEVRVSLARLTS